MTDDGDTNLPADRMDRAVAQRLAKLRAMPVNATRLSNALEAEIPRPPASARSRRLWLRPLRAVAASIVVAGLVAALIVGLWSRPALA